MLTFTGDFGGLKRIEEKLNRAAQGKAKKALLRALEEEAINQVMEGFDAARDPYGVGWKSTARGGKILRHKGGLKRSIFRKRGADFFVIGFAKMYAAVHQYGATIKAKATRRVEYTARAPRKRKWTRGKSRSGTWREGWTRRKKGFGGYYNVVKHIKALTFKVGGKWVSVDSVTIPARPMVPTAMRGLPPTWRAAFEKAAHAALRKILG